MPKLPHLSGGEIIRALERLGFQQARQKGSHVILKRGSSGCVVPLHREVKTAGTRQVLTLDKSRPTTR
ncbi:MAG: type II toxin-antitoxin system HicA family toxin [Opitutaceae bacterium]